MSRLGLETSEEALDFTYLVQPGSLVVWGQAMAEPLTLTSRLIAQRAAIGGFRAFIGISWSDHVEPQSTDFIQFESYCGGANNRRLGDRLGILPIHYSELSSVLAKQGVILLLQLAAGADEDHFSFGAAQEYLADLLPHARLVIAEVNAQAPYSFGGPTISRSDIDVIVRSDRSLAEASPTRGHASEQKIAEHVTGLIEDGATLQIGLGSIPTAVLRALGGHKNLGVHSGLITDDVVDLIEQGAINNACKRFDSGLTVTGLLAGGPRLSSWAHSNRSLAMRPTSYTHAHDNLARLDRFTAINSALEVDLTGQINAEVVNGHYLGAVGGAVDFLRGARASHRGLPIVALPSTNQAASRIVVRLGGPVSTSRADAGVIVTEHGVADLRGLSLSARRQRMLAIADPIHREALEIASERETN